MTIEDDDVAGEARGGVLRVYGEVMDLVQYWELALAVLWWRKTRKRGKPNAEVDSPRSERAVRGLQKAYLKTSPQETRAVVADVLGDAAAENFQALIERRNWLAHAALRQRRRDDGDFDHGTIDDLVAIGRDVSTHLAAVMHAIDQDPDVYEGPVLPGWEEATASILGRLEKGQSVLRR
jgi:hypothetical protein